MCRWVRELVLLIIAVLECDENAQVMSSCCDSYTRAGEFGTEMVVSTGSDTFLRTINVKR